MALIRVDDPADPRLAPYRDVRERDLVGRQGRFVAEGEVVIRTLLGPASRCRAESLLLAAKRVEKLADALAGLDPAVPVYVADQPVMDAVAGFPIHRGMLAIGLRPEAPPAAEALAEAGPGDLFVAACGIGNHDNLGGLFRNAAAFGARAVLLDDRCCDPLYRKAIRVSVGAALRLPFADFGPAEALPDLLAAHGIEAIALSPRGAEPLHRLTVTGPACLVLGAEGPGLPEAVLARCRTVAIPMAGGFDSLNVAATSAVALHRLRFGG